MSPFVIFPYYLAWHYTLGLRDYLSVWGNIMWFLYNFFSIKILFKTFFAPFKRLTEKKRSILDFGSFFEALLINTLMRIIGIILRSIMIVVGILSICLAFFVGLASFFLWLALPFLLIFIMVIGLIGLFKI